MRIWVGLLTVGFLAACGSGDSDQRPTHDPFDPTIVREAPSAQAEILADGRVEWEEYERAFFAYVACLEERGIPHGQPEVNDRRRPPTWTVGIGPYHQDDTEEVQRVSNRCYFESLAAVEMAWQVQEGPTEAEQQELNQEMVECLNERTGLEVPDHGTLQAMIRARELTDDEFSVFARCWLFVMEGDDSLLNRE